jgi:hypothetical protein
VLEVAVSTALCTMLVLFMRYLPSPITKYGQLLKRIKLVTLTGMPKVTHHKQHQVRLHSSLPNHS